MNHNSSIAVAYALGALLFTSIVPAAANPFGAKVSVPGASTLQVIDRPEIRSFQPYSGLRYGFRPTPPARLGVRTGRPQVIMPKRVAPLIGYGNPPPSTSLGYAYCAERPSGTIEPSGPPYRFAAGRADAVPLRASPLWA